jgi:hypothetical protein
VKPPADHLALGLDAVLIDRATEYREAQLDVLRADTGVLLSPAVIEDVVAACRGRGRDRTASGPL